MKNNVVKIFIDIGSKTLKAIVGELFVEEDNQTLKVLEYVTIPSRGIENGDIVNEQEFTESLKELKSKLKTNIRYVSIAISGMMVQKSSQKIEINLNEKTELDNRFIDEFINRAKERILESGDKIIQKDVFNLKLDDKILVRELSSHSAQKISGIVYIVYLDKKKYLELKNCFEQAGFILENIILSTSASANAILTKKDLENGVILIDMGYGTTDIAIYKYGYLIYTDSAKLGIQSFINDTTWIKEIKDSDYKFNYATEIIDKYRKNNIVAGNLFYNKGAKVPFDLIERVVSARRENIDDTIYEMIQNAKNGKFANNGIVLTGGAIYDPLIEGENFIHNLNDRLNKPVNIVIPENYFSGLQKTTTNMSVVLGLMYIVMETEHRRILKMDETLAKEFIHEDEDKKIEEEDKEESGVQTVEEIKEEKIETQIEDNDSEEEPEKKGWFKQFISYFI